MEAHGFSQTHHSHDLITCFSHRQLCSGFDMAVLKSESLLDVGGGSHPNPDRPPLMPHRWQMPPPSPNPITDCFIMYVLYVRNHNSHTDDRWLFIGWIQSWIFMMTFHLAEMAAADLHVVWVHLHVERVLRICRGLCYSLQKIDWKWSKTESTVSKCLGRGPILAFGHVWNGWHSENILFISYFWLTLIFYLYF